jgi:hypothetical protein
VAVLVVVGFVILRDSLQGIAKTKSPYAIDVINFIPLFASKCKTEQTPLNQTQNLPTLCGHGGSIPPPGTRLKLV